VHRTPQHIYAQIIDPTGARVLASASTLETELRSSLKNGGNIYGRSAVGNVSPKGQAGRITRWHSTLWLQVSRRIKALADAARENGLEF